MSRNLRRDRPAGHARRDLSFRSRPSPAPTPLTGWALFGITTADRPDRRRRLERELGRLGLPFHVRVGDRPPDPGGFPSVGTRGCFESHLSCLRRARAEGVEVAVLVEDDAVVARRFGRLAAQIAAELGGLDWAICHLGYLRDQSPCHGDRLELVASHLGRSKGWEVAGAHFVAVNGDRIDEVIADFEARLEPGGHRIGADGVYNEFTRDNGLSPLLSLPNLARQAPSPSGIAGVTQLRTRLLYIGPVRTVAEAVKRAAWDLQSWVPPTLEVRRWNRQVRGAHPTW